MIAHLDDSMTQRSFASCRVASIVGLSFLGHQGLNLLTASLEEQKRWRFKHEMEMIQKH